MFVGLRWSNFSAPPDDVFGIQPKSILLPTEMAQRNCFVESEQMFIGNNSVNLVEMFI